VGWLFVLPVAIFAGLLSIFDRSDWYIYSYLFFIPIWMMAAYALLAIVYKDCETLRANFCSVLVQLSLWASAVLSLILICIKLEGQLDDSDWALLFIPLLVPEFAFLYTRLLEYCPCRCCPGYRRIRRDGRLETRSESFSCTDPISASAAASSSEPFLSGGWEEEAMESDEAGLPVPNRSARRSESAGAVIGTHSSSAAGSAALSSRYFSTSLGSAQAAGWDTSVIAGATYAVQDIEEGNAG